MSQSLEHTDAEPSTTVDRGGSIDRPRGKHKVFLGYAPGVGKTYTMLSEARRRAERGEDIVIGFVEPHDRPETIALLDGLEQIPTKHIEYRGKTLQELDTDAILRRHPEWVVVDELAHTNAPGSHHEKRWQSVEELLDAGINVISTVNVQHLESLNDTVFDITGIRVRETLPDRIVDSADEVVLADLTPQALINRLRRGVVYKPEKVPQALHNFFRKGNLAALRELALRKTAQEVDDYLLDYMNEKDIQGSWPANDRVLVCVTEQPIASTLIRRGYRLAERLKGDLFCLHVRVTGRVESSDTVCIPCLEEAKRLADELGATWKEATGDSAAEAIVSFASEYRITQIILGQSARGRVAEIVRGSVVNRIMRETIGIDVLVVADPTRT